MIPQSYTSYVAPIMSSKLFNEVRSGREVDKHMYSQFEMPYVVHLHNKYEFAEPQKLFTFTHPNLGDVYVIKSGILLEFYLID